MSFSFNNKFNLVAIASNHIVIAIVLVPSRHEYFSLSRCQSILIMDSVQKLVSSIRINIFLIAHVKQVLYQRPLFRKKDQRDRLTFKKGYNSNLKSRRVFRDIFKFLFMLVENSIILDEVSISEEGRLVLIYLLDLLSFFSKLI